MSARLVAAALLLALCAGPLAAQSLPDWAKPSPIPSPMSPEAMMAPPTLPGGGGVPTQVPIDGGLGLLALAGGAYAVRRLRNR